MACFSTVGEMIASHWIATARLKLSSPQPVRCCPATVCLLQWVLGDMSIAAQKADRQTMHQTNANINIKDLRSFVSQLGTCAPCAQD